MWWPFTKPDNTVVTSSEKEVDLGILSTVEGGEFDPALLEQLSEKWMDDYMGELDSEVKRILWEAIEACRQNGEGK